MGLITRLVIEQDDRLKYNIVGFIDDNIQMKGKLIGGLPVFSKEVAFGKEIERLKVKEIIFAINKENVSTERKAELIDRCLTGEIKVREVPETSQWINGKLSVTQIKSINIEDLLSRDAIKLDNEKAGIYLNGKSIMVTGAVRDCSAYVRGRC